MPNLRVPLLVAVAAISLLAACTSAPAPSPTQPPATAPAAPKAATSAPVGASPAAPKAASPSPAPKAAAAPVRVEPKGKLTYALHTTATPRNLDPQDRAATSDYLLYYVLHDGLVKSIPGNSYGASLAESYETAPDFKSTTFKLRPGLKFHDGSAITPEDVKFSFENYKGTFSANLKGTVDRIDIPDARTIVFRLKEPSLDWMELYAGKGSGAAWIIPAKYYAQVGPDGFKQKPIGAGPYKFVSQVAGDSMEFEAFTDYWRKTPSIKNLTVRSIPDNTTRLAALQVGEIDVVTGMLPLQVEQIRADPKLVLAPVQSGNYFLSFNGIEKPTSPFADKRVREAVNLALDRPAIVNFHTGGLGENPGNWITRDLPDALDLKPPAQDLTRAKQLLTQAGFPDGFDAGAMSPFFPNGPLGEFVGSQLRGVGIRTTINNMERAAFDVRRGQGPTAFPDGILVISGSYETSANMIRTMATCKGADSRTCDPLIEEPFQKYEKSLNVPERQQILTQIQRYIMDNVFFVPIVRNVFVDAQGPRVANKPEDIWGTAPSTLYLGPLEDVRLKD